MGVEMTAPVARPLWTIPDDGPPARCDRCRRLTRWFGCGAPWNGIPLENCCRVCSSEKAVFEARAIVHALCATKKKPGTDRRLLVRVLRAKCLETLIWDYAIGSPKLFEMHVQEHIWMEMLKGKYVRQSAILSLDSSVSTL